MQTVLVTFTLKAKVLAVGQKYALVFLTDESIPYSGNLWIPKENILGEVDDGIEHIPGSS